MLISYWVPAVAFGCALVFFHVFEVILVMVFNPQMLSLSSCLITLPYVLAMSTAWVEFFLEAYFYPEMKTTPLFFVGLALMIVGEFIRKGAMIQAGVSFTHCIQTRKRPNHHLVTTGFYRFVRHPGYLGWFLFANGTQVMLANPASFCAFVVVTWRFFQWRIPYEEDQLTRLFGEAYTQYRARTWVGVPFVDPNAPID